MALVGRVLEEQEKMSGYVRLMARADGTSAVLEAVRRYLASWPKECIARVQRIDAGWAPFDIHQRPLQISGVLDVRCIRDAVHSHCMALTEAGVALTPELAELDFFFSTATQLAEAIEPPAARAPAIPRHRALTN